MTDSSPPVGRPDDPYLARCEEEDRWRGLDEQTRIDSANASMLERRDRTDDYTPARDLPYAA